MLCRRPMPMTLRRKKVRINRILKTVDRELKNPSEELIKRSQKE